MNEPKEYYRATKERESHPSDGVGRSIRETICLGYFEGERSDIRSFLEACGHWNSQLEEITFRRITAETIQSLKDAKENLSLAEQTLKAIKV